MILLFKKKNIPYDWKKDKAEIASLKYHSSWDSLMPVCHKIDNLYIEEKKSIAPVRNEYAALCDKIDNAVTLYEIEPFHLTGDPGRAGFGPPMARQ